MNTKKMTEFYRLVAECQDVTTLRDMQSALKAQYRKLQTTTKRNFYVGQAVSFTSKGTRHVGRVSKINPKTVMVTVASATIYGWSSVTWKVSPLLLQPAEESSLAA